ncbi:MAG: MATE family efflux transporter [Planctomycetes bacterium]|nr:MATE family efflux transporter [Planctomycetota bacterium]
MSGAPRLVASDDGLLRHGPARVVWQLGLPLALGLASHALINLVDLLLIGRLGEAAVRAAHVATTWNFVPMIVGNCVTTALLARLSRALAADRPAARQFHRRAEWCLLWFGALVSLLSAAPASAMVAWTGIEGAAADDAVHYLVVSNLGCLPMFALMQTTAAMRAAGEARMPLLLLLLANVLNLGLDLVLLFGWPALGLPGIGVVGAAYASVAARTVAAVLAFAWLARARHPLSLRAVPAAVPPLPVLRPLLADAWPQVLQIGLRAGVVLALTAVVQRRFGDAAVAALGITTRLDTLILFAALGFANAATAYSGRAVVVGWPDAARAAGLWAAAAAGGFGALLLAGLWWGCERMVGWFLPDATGDVVDVAVAYVGSVGWSQVLGAVALGAIGAVHGAGRMVLPLVVDVVGFGFVYGPLWWCAASDADLATVFASLVAGMAVVAVLHVTVVAFGRWPRPR